eukprot:100435_1
MRFHKSFSRAASHIFSRGRLIGVGSAVLGAAAFSTSVAHAESAQVYSWGSGQYYQTGLGHAKNIPLPTNIEHLNHSQVAQVACGGQQSMALTADGEVYTFGRGENFRLGHGGDTNESYPRLVESLLGQNIVEISCGERHMAAVNDKGELWTWGKNVAHQLGHSPSNIPQKVESLAKEKITAVSCGKLHTLVLTEDGKVFSCGSGRRGALGNGSKDDQKEFTQIEALKNKTVTQISAGEDFSLFLTSDGNVYSCGASDFGQTGLGQGERYTRTPRLITVFRPLEVVAISAGSLHAAACTSSGALFTWGENKTGQLGHGDTFHRTTPHCVRALDGHNVTGVECGGHHTAALSVAEGKIFLFGDGRFGQIGRGDNNESVAAFRDRPVEITHFSSNGKIVRQVALGSDHTVVLAEI